MQNLKQVSKMSVGEQGIIHHIGNANIALKLYSMGVLPGKSLSMIRKAPLGGGFYLKMLNHNLALREEEASEIYLELKEKN